jgi:DNA-binding GntR family transcriptional regulator
MAELYVVRTELEGLAARLAAQHASEEEIDVLQQMVGADRTWTHDASALSRSNKRFHKQLHLASHNRFLVQQLDLVHRSMALLATTSLAVEGRGPVALDEHQTIVTAISERNGAAAYQAVRQHLSQAFITRLQHDAGE